MSRSRTKRGHRLRHARLAVRSSSHVAEQYPGRYLARCPIRATCRAGRTVDVSVGAGSTGRYSRCGLSVVLPLIVAALIVGCSSGAPTTVGTHRFGIYPDFAWAVEDPPTSGSLFGSSTAGIGAAQFSPDGTWLYVTWYDCRSCTLASISVDRSRPGVLSVHVGTESHCFFSCVADTRAGATRLALNPPIDPANPPSVVSASSGDAVPVEPWLP